MLFWDAYLHNELLWERECVFVREGEREGEETVKICIGTQKIWMKARLKRGRERERERNLNIKYFLKMFQFHSILQSEKKWKKWKIS